MATRKVGVCYHASIDMIEVFFESKAGYYGHPVFEDEYVQPRYDDDGNLIGFMIEGARNMKKGEWHDVDLPLVDEEQAALKKTAAQAD